MEEKFNSLENCDEILDFVKKHEMNHTYYCHYSTLTNMDKILDSEYIWLSSLKDFNDLCEFDSADENENLYALCFSALYSENLPMWYLYGGVTGKGARITFKKTSFIKWLNNLEFILINTRTDETENYIPVSVETHDVIYISSENGNCRIKYNGGINKKLTIEGYNLLKEKHKGFVKSLPWFYEKEFRILVLADDEASRRLNAPNSEIRLAVRLRKDDFRTFDVMLGPESVITDYSAYIGFTKFLSYKIQKSSFDKIKMNLLRKNQKSIVDDISQWYEERFSESLCKYIHSQNNCSNSKEEDNK